MKNTPFTGILPHVVSFSGVHNTCGSNRNFFTSGLMYVEGRLHSTVALPLSLHL